MTKQFNVKLSPEEDQRLKGLSKLMHMSKGAVLKSSLSPSSFFGEALVYEAMKKIDQHLQKKDTEAVREEMMQLCLSLNSLTKKTESSTTTSMNC